MFGDSQLLIRLLQGSVGSETPILASFASNSVGSRKIAENDKVMPMDRVFFGYNEFHGMVPPLASTFNGPLNPPASAQLSRLTVGVEKTFLDGDWSAEARIAVSSSPDMSLEGTRYDGGTPAALTFYLKNLLYSDDTTALGAGLGVGVPCSSDVVLSLPTDTLRYREETLHLMPYIGFMTMPTDNWFFQGFLQLDFSTGENQLDSMASGQPIRSLASLPEQHMLFADFSLGRWLYRDDEAPFLSGLAGIVEFHYLTTLNDSDPVNALGAPGPNNVPTGIYTLSSIGNRVDMLNITAGLQFQFGQLSNLRVAAVAPLTTGYNRFFDGELQVSFNRQF